MPAARLYQRTCLLIQLPIPGAALALVVWLWQTWMPLPPTELTLSAGRADGIYHRHAQRYAELFARYGVRLTVLESEGAVQNLRRLAGIEPPAADLALVQGGIVHTMPAGDSHAGLLTLANVDVEALWVFSRLPWIDTLHSLQGLRVSLGPAGSGTRALGLALLAQAGLAPGDYEDSMLAGLPLVRALQSGDLDAALLVQAPGSPVIAALMRAPGVHLVPLRQATAITERLPALRPALLAQGALGDDGRVPARDTPLLVLTASLLARASLDPALQRLAAQVAREAHGGGGLFHRPGELPSLRRVEWPPSEPARQTLLHGLPWLEARLPFTAAQWLWRLLVIVLPVTLLALWLALLVPAWLRWLLEARLARWYGELMYIEHDLRREAITGIDLTRHLARLDGIERRMSDFAAPDELMPRWFLLRQHIDFVRLGLLRRRGR